VYSAKRLNIARIQLMAVTRRRGVDNWGTQWLRSRRSLIAEVPSIVVPDEFNVLINPGHPGAAKLIAKKVRRWNYDTRLV
jgi:RES domain-containing protein